MTKPAVGAAGPADKKPCMRNSPMHIVFGPSAERGWAVPCAASKVGHAAACGCPHSALPGISSIRQLALAVVWFVNGISKCAHGCQPKVEW